MTCIFCLTQHCNCTTTGCFRRVLSLQLLHYTLWLAFFVHDFTKLETVYPVRTLIRKLLGPRLALGWVTIQGLDADAVATNTVKSQKRRNGASIICFWGPKKINEIFVMFNNFPTIYSMTCIFSCLTLKFSPHSLPGILYILGYLKQKFSFLEHN